VAVPAVATVVRIAAAVRRIYVLTTEAMGRVGVTPTPSETDREWCNCKLRVLRGEYAERRKKYDIIFGFSL